MCGISGAVSLSGEPIPHLRQRLEIMNDLQSHRGPDGTGIWTEPRNRAGFGHRRLSIIDIATGAQPMTDGLGHWITYNGEIYNYLELREELGRENFTTTSDTEVILRAYRKWGPACVERLRGMFAFALWDDTEGTLFCARDRFGIKPFYHARVGDTLYFASEIKALLPFLPSIETDLEGFREYLAFQFCLAGRTLFKGVQELAPAHTFRVARGQTDVRRYWQVYYHIDHDHTAKYFGERLRELLEESVRLHLRSDVPVGAYVSGGLDSAITSLVGSKHAGPGFRGFTGKFAHGPEYDESAYARAVAKLGSFPLEEIEITAGDFVDTIRKVIYHLDYPVAGPGSFPQYMVSGLAARRGKVVLGGQGGDEIFGGYTRYLIAYFEQCIKAAIDGTMGNGRFVVTYESIIPNLSALKRYKPMLQEFWREGLFEDMDRRYFRLINRAPLLQDEIRWELLGDYCPFETFKSIFHGNNVGKESYFDLMTHFDFKTLLPALLQVEDRVSMAHGLEARVPMLDHPLVEHAATIPSDVKFKDGTMKYILRETMRPSLPPEVVNRTDKMGFPVPLTQWLKTELKEFVTDTLRSRRAAGRSLIDNAKVVQGMEKESQFGRKIWGLLCLELWQQEFHDRAAEFADRLASLSTAELTVKSPRQTDYVEMP